MKSKTFIILLLICVLLGAASWFLLGSGPSTGRKADDPSGDPLLTALPVKEILTIEITGHQRGVHLEKGETTWRVRERYGYPADFVKLSDLVLKLRDMKVDRTFPASDEILARLSLNAPDGASDPSAADARGTRVVLKGRNDAVLSSVVIGKTRDSDTGRGGNYVMVDGDKAVYVVDKAFHFLDTDPEKWIDKEILDVAPERIAEVRRIDPGAGAPRYIVRRPDPEKPAGLLDVPADKTAASVKINRLMDALSTFRIDDVVDPKTPAEATGLDTGACFEYGLFDGTVYTLCLGGPVTDHPDRTYFKARVAFTPPSEAPATAPEKTAPAGEETAADAPEAPVDPAENTDAPTDGTESTAPAPEETVSAGTETTAGAPETPADPAVAAAELNQRISPWIFAVPKWKADQFILDKADFFENRESD
ncbi:MULTISPECIES: DUF4340 domain-containing protein [Desulfococcus]|uniref:DUF4340 domain-containing protein n=1 Tax=Desulfococcus multivorans DSM 2059 TaxID=1121405 RepID=S7U5L1_DESML|nr:DUF4340 domain-containing protein [Desulfococcus multivorans]AOY60237.1 uncharacterized protein Dmul_34680 [Desulfococcus multivorans]AQV02351.1 hypothetical protein B2D07_17320 [Desulfococcus multivorans]EPR44627.1 protein of unknown function DUF4340 [Desulfococcus multivorans DSM 2059]SKA07385.1 protein of unknown function [Desulfococcus multivorans DSM 2059]